VPHWLCARSVSAGNETLLSVCASERSALLTNNVRDFIVIAKRWSADSCSGYLKARVNRVSTHENNIPPDQIAREFVEAFNRRDTDGLLALVHPEIEFRPTMLVGSERVYRGHDGFRSWAEDLAAAEATHQVRVRDIRVLEDRRFLVLSEVLLDGEVVAPSAMVAKLEEGKIVEAHAYLSDEAMLTELGLLR
jgi:ketosteroid isomerase-like protein